MRPRVQQQSPSELALVHAPAWEELGDLGPAVAKASLRQANAAVLIRRPRILADGGVELVLEALPALLATAALELRSDNGPLSQPVLLYQRDDQVILLLRPRPPALRAKVSGHSMPMSAACRPRLRQRARGNGIPCMQRRRTRAPTRLQVTQTARTQSSATAHLRRRRLPPMRRPSPAQRPCPAGARPRGQARAREGSPCTRRAVPAPWRPRPRSTASRRTTPPASSTIFVTAKERSRFSLQ